MRNSELWEYPNMGEHIGSPLRRGDVMALDDAGKNGSTTVLIKKL